MKKYTWCKYDNENEVIVLPDNSSLREGDEVKIISIKNKGGKENAF